MSTASLRNRPEPNNEQLVQWTLRGIEVAKAAASAAAEGIASGSAEPLTRIRACEEELDSLDREINETVTTAITNCVGSEAREQLACLKFIMELERIGDLLLNFGIRSRATVSRLEPQDVKDLTMMASIVEKMLGDVYQAFAERDLQKTLSVLRTDAELDRLRNLMFVRHIENPENAPKQESFHVVFMTQVLERSGDHVKNLAEEVCHLVSGRSVRHLLRASDKPFEEMFLDWMRRQETARR